MKLPTELVEVLYACRDFVGFLTTEKLKQYPRKNLKNGQW
jgi:hypothetical protein